MFLYKVKMQLINERTRNYFALGKILWEGYSTNLIGLVCVFFLNYKFVILSSMHKNCYFIYAYL